MLNTKQYFNNIYGSEYVKTDHQCYNELHMCLKEQVEKGFTNIVIYPMCEMAVHAINILNTYFGLSPLIADDYYASINPNVIYCNDIPQKAPDSIVIVVDNRVETYDETRKKIMSINSHLRIIDSFPIKPLFRQDSRIISFELASREIYRHGIEGDVAEVGVYRGYMASYINEFFADRAFHMFDTFCGFDKRDCELEHIEGFSSFTERDLFIDTNTNIVIDKMTHPEKCVFHKGYFPNTTNEIDDKTRFCFVHLDADLYSPIKAGLYFFYQRLSPGGYIFVHDFNGVVCKGVRKAVEEFCVDKGIGYVCLPDSIEKGTAVITKGLI